MRLILIVLYYVILVFFIVFGLYNLIEIVLQNILMLDKKHVLRIIVEWVKRMLKYVIELMKKWYK